MLFVRISNISSTSIQKNIPKLTPIILSFHFDFEWNIAFLKLYRKSTHGIYLETISPISTCLYLACSEFHLRFQDLSALL